MVCLWPWPGEAPRAGRRALGPRREPSPRLLGLPWALPAQPRCSGRLPARQRGRRPREGPWAPAAPASPPQRRLAALSRAWLLPASEPRAGTRPGNRALRPAQAGGSIHLINWYQFSCWALRGTARVKCEQLVSSRERCHGPQGEGGPGPVRSPLRGEVLGLPRASRRGGLRSRSLWGLSRWTPAGARV